MRHTNNWAAGVSQIMESVAYERRVCAFVDILGFECLVERSKRCPSLVGEISRALERVREASPLGRGTKNRGVVFSDSIVLSSDLEPASVWSLLMSTAIVSINLANLGVLARGGISLGPLLHTESQIFGSAMVSAYRLEKSVALYPRVVVDKEVEIQLGSLVDPYASVQPAPTLASYLRQGPDGVAYVDFLSEYVLRELGYDPPEFLAWLHQQLRSQVPRIGKKDLRVREKWRWFAEYLSIKQSDIGLSRPPVRISIV